MGKKNKMKTKKIGILSTTKDKVIRRFKDFAIIYSEGSGYCIYRSDTIGWLSWNDIRNWMGRYYNTLAEALESFFETLTIWGYLKQKSA